MSDLTPSSTAIEVALEKVLSGAAFRGRPHLRRLLTHLVQYSLAENGDPLFRRSIARWPTAVDGCASLPMAKNVTTVESNTERPRSGAILQTGPPGRGSLPLTQKDCDRGVP